MRIKLINNPVDSKRETPVARITHGKDQYNFFGYNICIVLCADKKHRLSVIDDSIVLDSHKLRLIANALDEFNRKGGAVA